MVSKRAALAAAVFGGLSHGAWAQSYSRTEVITYEDNTAVHVSSANAYIWVLGQTKSVTCVAAIPTNAACDGTADPGNASSDISSETTYDTTYALPLTSKSFGKTQATLGYDTTSLLASGQLGSLKTVMDGRSQITTLTNWKRGVPQSVSFPTSPATSKSAVVDDNGLITSVTDETGAKTCYSYDNVGRLTGVTYPSETIAGACDTAGTNWKSRVCCPPPPRKRP